MVDILFDSSGLLSHIDSTSPPSPASDEKIVTNWVTADRRAHGISQLVTIDIHVEMRFMWTAQEIWYYL